MQKLFLTILFFYYASVVCTPLNPDMIDRIKKATVYIKVVHDFPLTGDQVTTTGSGFFISKYGHIITNYHVVQPQISIYNLNIPAPVKELQVICNSGRKDYVVMPAVLLNRDEENDIAILKISDTLLTPFLTIDSKEELFETMSLWVFGYPSGDQITVIQRGPEITVSKGAISSLRHDDCGNLSHIQIDAQVNAGNSGGPVINEKGMVIGVVRMILNTGVNFVIPCRYIDSLISKTPIEKKYIDTALLHVTLTPSDAILFIDEKPVRHTAGSMIKVPASWHMLNCYKHGYESWMEGTAILDTYTVSITLKPQKNLPINVTDKNQPKVCEFALSDFKKVKVLLKENFDSPKRFESWEQSTGGTAKRTWFLENGTLNQFESNEVLHAIYLGDTTWSDYIASAYVRIIDEHEDSRAGIIFRETPDGFYLFRIHRQTDKAQLAYHCKQPFGWFIITEKELDFDINDKWYTMTVAASGNSIACFLDARCLFTADDDYSKKGRIGFYSVESKTSFDSLEVFELSSGNKKSISHRFEILSFWFSDYFTKKSVWWEQYSSENDTPAFWLFGDGGCALYNNIQKKSCCEFTKYVFDDFSLNLLLSAGKGNDKSVFEIFFRKTDKGQTTLRFSKNDSKISLIVKKGDKEKKIKSVSMPEDLFGNTNRLFLEVKDDGILLGSSEKKLLESVGRLSPAVHGRLGITATEVPIVLHEMAVSSVNH